MEKIVASFWQTREGFKGVSKLELLCIKSWLDNGYKFLLYTYNMQDKIFNKLNELFENFILKDANELVPFDRIFFDDRGAGLAAFSDYFRFKMIQTTGIAWVDLDMICLGNKNTSLLNENGGGILNLFDKPYIINKEMSYNGQDVITTSLLRFPKDSLFGEKLIKEAEKIIDNRKQVPWGCIGPQFLQKICKQENLEKEALDYRESCQINWFETEKFVLKNQEIDYSRFCLHLFTEMWRTKDMLKDASYDKNSIYERLLAKHDIKNLLKQVGYSVSFYDKYFYRYVFIMKLLFKKTRIKKNNKK